MEIFEALLGGLCVLLPPKPRDWLKDNLKILSSIPFLQLGSDVLIPEHIRPFTTKPWRRFSYSDYVLQYLGPPVNPWKMTIAREFSKRSDQRKCLRKWKRLIEDTKEIESSDDRTATAQICYARKTMNKFLSVWRDYVRRRRRNIAAFCNMMKEVERNNRLSMSFQSLKAWVFGEAEILSGSLRRVQRDWFTELPEHIQRKIFFYLTPMDFERCALVNQAWKVAVDLNAATIDLDLSKISNRTTNAMLLKLLHQRRKKVRKISLANCSLLTSSGLAALALCTNLQVVNLANCPNVTDEIIESLLCGCPTLIKLDLSCTPISDKSLINLTQHADKLGWLSLAYCASITDIGLSFFEGSQLVCSLQCVNLSGCLGVTSFGLVTFAQAMGGVRRWILNDLPQLTNGVLKAICSRAVLESLEYRHRATPIKHSMIQKEISQFRNYAKQTKRITSEGSTINIWNDELKSLCIYGDERLRDFGFGHQHPEKLTKLVIVNCPNVEDQVIGRLVELENLRCLNLSHCYRLTDRCASLICGSGYADRLRELYLAYCYELTDSGVSPLMERLVSLSHLSLEGCSALTDEALIGIRNCRNLCWINVSRTRLSDMALERCANLPRLSSINLSDCQHISDRGLIRITTQLGRLEVLRLSKCRGITTRGIEMVICHSQGIQTLDLSRVKTVTNSVLRSIWSHCPYLRILKISNCTRVTEAELARLCTKCTQLRYLEAQGIALSKPIRRLLKLKIEQFVHKSGSQKKCGDGENNMNGFL